jgi:hypothetical protein
MIFHNKSHSGGAILAYALYTYVKLHIGWSVAVYR